MINIVIKSINLALWFPSNYGINKKDNKPKRVCPFADGWRGQLRQANKRYSKISVTPS